jgi:two-component system sensor histidine kinase TctE
MSTPNLLASLRFRLLIGLVCIFGLGGAAMLFLVRLNSFSAHIAVEEKSLDTQARDLLANLRLDGAGRLVSMEPPRAWRSAYREPQAAYFTLYDPGGRPVARSGNLALPLPLHTPAPGQAIGPLRIEGRDQDLTLNARGPGGYALVVGRSHPGRFDEADPDVLEDLAPALVFGLFAILGLAAAWLIAVASLRPLTRASREAAAIGPGTTAARLTEDALPTEVRPLARAVNAALDRVAAAYDGEKRFIADAAHALRTPLTVLDLRLQRAQAEGSVDWPAIRRDVSELARLAAGLLDLSVAEQKRRAAAPKPVDLGRLAREVAAGFAPRLEAGAREIEVRAPDAPIRVRAEPGAIRDLLTALIDNALTHGVGQVTVEVARGEAGAYVLRVSDEGAGVSPERQAEVFERFHKLDANSPGAGLGLAIARQIARNAGGDVVFVAPATVEVRLPG